MTASTPTPDTRTAGQVAYEAALPNHSADRRMHLWSTMPVTMQAQWETSAAAVIAHHVAQQEAAGLVVVELPAPTMQVEDDAPRWEHDCYRIAAWAVGPDDKPQVEVDDPSWYLDPVDARAYAAALLAAADAAESASLDTQGEIR